MNPLEAALVEHIEEHGPIGFDEYVDHALYAPDLGFYQRGGGAGRRRDFLTSPEVGPLFGLVISRALDRWWDELGRPDPFLVVDAGAGPGTLARSVLLAEPRCRSALRLVLVEPGEAQWATHPDGVETRSDLPQPGELGDGPCVVLANELLDNLPFGLVELTERGWCEVGVGVLVEDLGADLADDGGGGGEDGDRASRPGRRRLAEATSLLEEHRAAWCWGKAGRDAAIGTRLPVQAAAAAWLDDALGLVGHGRVVVIDYARTTKDMAARPWPEWLRTYAEQGRAGHPLTAPGTCDITVDVAVDQLSSVEAPTSQRDQATFLRAHGLDELVEEGAARWRAEGIGGGLGAIAGRSRVHEGDALTDTAGLGGFTVLEWSRPSP